MTKSDLSKACKIGLTLQNKSIYFTILTKKKKKTT